MADLSIADFAWLLHFFLSQARLPIPFDAGPGLLDENPPGVSEHLHLRIGLLSPPQRELMLPIARA